jgi:hypothetical protein
MSLKSSLGIAESATCLKKQADRQVFLISSAQAPNLNRLLRTGHFRDRISDRKAE